MDGEAEKEPASMKSCAFAIDLAGFGSGQYRPWKQVAIMPYTLEELAIKLMAAITFGFHSIADTQIHLQPNPHSGLAFLVQS
jgi:hypothetical protein